VWVGFGAIAGAGLYWRVANRIPISPLDGVVNAAMMPKTLAMVLAGLGLALVLRAGILAVLNARALRRATSGAEAPVAAMAGKAADDDDSQPTRRENLRAAGMLMFGLAFLLVVPVLGYAVSVALLVGGVSAFMGTRPGWKLAGISAAAAVTFHIIFVELLSIPLPPGIWPNLFG